MLVGSGPGLGFILAPLGQEVAGQFPNEINYSGITAGSDLCPPDPQWNSKGEAGMYYDSPLGGLRGEGIPTDAELATVYGYMPVISGEVVAKEGHFPGPWIPPSNYSAAGQYGPQPSLNGLRGASGTDTPTWLVFVVIAGLGLAGWWAWREFQKPVSA
jgi:hypothetical protein